MAVDVLDLEKLNAALPLLIDELKQLGNVTTARRAEENRLTLLRNQTAEEVKLQDKARAEVDAEVKKARDDVAADVKTKWDAHERAVQLSKEHAQAELDAMAHQKGLAATEIEALRKQGEEERAAIAERHNELAELHAAKQQEAADYAETKRKHAEFKASVGA